MKFTHHDAECTNQECRARLVGVEPRDARLCDECEGEQTAADRRELRDAADRAAGLAFAALFATMAPSNDAVHTIDGAAEMIETGCTLEPREFRSGSVHTTRSPAEPVALSPAAIRTLRAALAHARG